MAKTTAGNLPLLLFGLLALIGTSTSTAMAVPKPAATSSLGRVFQAASSIKAREGKRKLQGYASPEDVIVTAYENNTPHLGEVQYDGQIFYLEGESNGSDGSFTVEAIVTYSIEAGENVRVEMDESLKPVRVYLESNSADFLTVEYDENGDLLGLVDHGVRRRELQTVPRSASELQGGIRRELLSLPIIQDIVRLIYYVLSPSIVTAFPACTLDSCPQGEICCPVKKVCEVEVTTGACGDPHMTGFLGQKFDFTGEDGAWYCLVNDGPSMHLNMRVTAPVPAVPQITYITGLSIITADVQGVDHTIEIAVTDPHNLDSSCPEGVSPCLADGALTVKLDGQESLISPGEVTLGPGVAISAVNLPGSCRSFGFEKYWERKKLENASAGRRLDAIGFMQDMGEWILSDPTATNMAECNEYVAAAGTTGLFEHESEHTSFQIMTPIGTIRLSHGRLHQLAMRDPTDQFDLPDHLTWQMNVAIDHHDVSLEATGVLGETVVPTVDANGKYIMKGLDAIRGSPEDYRVTGPLETAFAQGHH